MRIVRITSTFGFIKNYRWSASQKIPDSFGGVQIQTYLLVKCLDKKGYIQTIFTPRIDGATNTYKNAQIVPCHFLFNWLVPFVVIIKSLFKKFDIIHVHSGMEMWVPIVGIVLSVIKRVPLVCTIHMSWFNVIGVSPLVLFAGRTIEQLCKKVSKITIVLSNDVAGLSNNKIFIPDTVEDLFFKSQIKTKREKYVLFVGRFVYQKGIDILIKAYNKSKLFKKGVHLYCLGKQSNFKLSKFSQGIHLSEDVVSRKEVANKMNRCLALLAPSRFEERGTVIGESLATGTPVYTSALENLKKAYFDAPNKAITYIPLKVNDWVRILNNMNCKYNYSLRNKFREYAKLFSEEGTATRHELSYCLARYNSKYVAINEIGVFIANLNVGNFIAVAYGGSSIDPQKYNPQYSDIDVNIVIKKGTEEVFINNLNNDIRVIGWYYDSWSPDALFHCYVNMNNNLIRCDIFLFNESETRIENDPIDKLPLKIVWDPFNYFQNFRIKRVGGKSFEKFDFTLIHVADWIYYLWEKSIRNKTLPKGNLEMFLSMIGKITKNPDSVKKYNLSNYLEVTKLLTNLKQHLNKVALNEYSRFEVFFRKLEALIDKGNKMYKKPR